MEKQFYQWNSNPISKTHGLNPMAIIYQKPNSHWQYQKQILTGNIKSPIHIGNIIKSPILIGNIKSPIYIGNIKSPILIGNIKSLILIDNIKAQFTLAISKS